METDKVKYSGAKVILAPMVRVGTLPARLLALNYGADLVFCEEIIDRRILMCKRIENLKLGTVDFQLEEDAQAAPIFRTCPSKERHALVFQMGTSDPDRALAAARMVEDLVSAVDVNMGCPKAYSIKGGMGAALLTRAEKVKLILTTLVKGLSIPVSCKIRLLGEAGHPDVEKTKDFVRACCSTGIAAITVHGRTRDERPRHPNHDDALAALRSVADEFGIPLVANGGSNEIKSRADVESFRTRTKADSVMLARAAIWDISIFRKEGSLSQEQVIRDYLKLCVCYENSTHNTKYVLQQMLQEQCDSVQGHALHASANLREICAAWGHESLYDEEVTNLHLVEEQNDCKTVSKRKSDPEATSNKRSKDNSFDDEGLVFVKVQFVRKEYPVSGASPKSILAEWAKKNSMNLPSYRTIQRDNDKFFKSVVTVGEKKFTAERWEKSKKFAEQAAALAYLTFHDMESGKRASPVVNDTF